MQILQSKNHRQLLDTLENCKQIPKNDRLFIRKCLLDGKLQVKQILAMRDLKRLQIRLRKYIQTYKNNNQDQRYYKDAVQSQNQWKSIYQTSATYRTNCPRIKTNSLSSQQNLHMFQSVSSQYHHQPNSKWFKNMTNRNTTNQKINNSQFMTYRKTEQKSLKKDSKAERIINHNTCKSKKIDKIQQNNSLLIDKQIPFNKSKNQKLHKKQQKQIIHYTSPQIHYTSSNNLMNNNFNYNNNEHLFTNPELIKQCQKFISKFNSTINYQTIAKSKESIQTNSIQSQQQNRLRVKRLLSDVHSEDLFDYIVDENVKRQFTPTSLYMTYEDFITKLDNYLKLYKNQTILTHKSQNNTQHLNNSLIILEPFSNAHQSLTIKNLVQFLNNYCLSKQNPFRTLFLQLDCGSQQKINLQKFKKRHSWKGEQVVKLFKNVMNSWGVWSQGNQYIDYWRFYWGKQSEQVQQFVASFNKSF